MWQKVGTHLTPGKFLKLKNMQNVVSLFCKNKIDARKKGEDEKNRGTILAEQIPQATIPIQLSE
jgi:hypothetical protein